MKTRKAFDNGAKSHSVEYACVSMIYLAEDDIDESRSEALSDKVKHFMCFYSCARFRNSAALGSHIWIYASLQLLYHGVHHNNPALGSTI